MPPQSPLASEKIMAFIATQYPANLTNVFIPVNPNLNVTSSLFGRSTNQANRGRECQYSLRLVF